MGKLTIGPIMRIVGWLATGIMAAAVLAMAVAAAAGDMPSTMLAQVKGVVLANLVGFQPDGPICE
jgi:hypothetical protein